MKAIAFASLALGAAASLAQGSVIVQWNYNSVTPDGVVGTGTQSASVGTGFTGTVLTTGSFVTGGGTDATAADNSAFSITGFAAANTGNNSRGAQFTGSTVGYWNIGFSWDHRSSGTASRYAQVQYTINGTSWLNANVVDLAATNGVFSSFAASGIGNAAANNPSFAVRVMATFAPGGSNYTGVSSTYGTTGTWRFDMATITGTANSAPNGGSYADNTQLPGGAPVVIDLSTLWSDADVPFGDIVSLGLGSGPAEFSLIGTMLTFTPPASIVGASQLYTFNFGVSDALGAVGTGQVDFTVTPSPGSAALLGVGMLAAGRRRRA